jgi:hypothetical protein
VAAPDLSSFLKKLETANLSGMSPEQAGDTIELLAKEELDQARTSKEDSRLVHQVQTWYTEAKAARASEEQQWYKNIDMYQGRQFTEWDDATKRMVERPAPDYEHRFSINIIEPIVRTEIAKTTSVHPRANVMPASNDEGDLQAALAGEQVWSWYYDTSTYHSDTFSMANFWRAMTGTGFGKTLYDQGAIDKHATAVREREFKEQSEQMLMHGVDISSLKPEPVRGKVDTAPVSPFHLFVGDLAETTLQKQPWIIHAHIMSAQKAKAVYGKYAKKGWEPHTVSASEIINLNHLGIRASASSDKTHVLVLEAYINENVHEAFPRGGMVVVAGGELVGVSKEGIPYAHGEYPFAMLSGIETGRFYRKSTIQSVTPIQNEVNRTYNQLIKQRDLLAKPMFYFDEGSFDPTRIRSRPGTHIPIRLGMRYPQPVPIQEVPQYTFNLLDRLLVHRDDISGQHQVSRATSPGADTAASALALLKETDDDYLSTTFDSIQEFTRTMARQFLCLAVQFWDEPRMVKITGLDQAINVRALQGSDIASGTDVTVDGDSVLPKSKAARVAQITEWIDKGIVPPEVGLEALEMGTLGRVYDRMKRDQDAARQENTDISKITPEEIEQRQAEFQQQMEEMMGQVEQEVGAAPTEMPPMPPMFPVNWYDNHAVHFEEHRLFANSPAYKALAPEVRKLHEEHAMLHMNEIMAQMSTQGEGAPADGGAESVEAQPAIA